MSMTDELQKLQRLHETGALNDEEFSLAKAKLLNGSTGAEPPRDSFYGGPIFEPAALERETRRWAFMLHLSVLAGFALPMAGLIVPIVIWQLKKPELPGIDEHGINVVNWIISLIIYSIASVVLCLVLIGIPMLIALGAVSIVFPIIAAIKANDGIAWKYPLSIPFLKPSPVFK